MKKITSIVFAAALFLGSSFAVSAQEKTDVSCKTDPAVKCICADKEKCKKGSCAKTCNTCEIKKAGQFGKENSKKACTNKAEACKAAADKAQAVKKAAGTCK